MTEAEAISTRRDTDAWPLKPSQIISMRQKLGKTQVELARMLSVDPSTVGRWESGQRCPRRIYIRMMTRLLQEAK